MHTVFALLCFVVVIHWLVFPYPSGLLHWHCGNLTIATVPAKQPWWIWINTPSEFIINDCITTTKQSTTKPCAYFLGYTVDYLQTKETIKKLSSTTCYIAIIMWNICIAYSENMAIIIATWNASVTACVHLKSSQVLGSLRYNFLPLLFLIARRPRYLWVVIVLKITDFQLYAGHGT